MNIKRSATIVNKVLERDRGICQCCYRTESIEVHHIEPLCDGGSDEPDNMICLCAPCHFLVPDDPDVFLDYQKSRGATGRLILADLLMEMSKIYPDTSIKDVFTWYESNLQTLFERAWNEWKPRESHPKNRRDKAEEKRQKVLAWFFDKDWVWAGDIRESEIATLALSSLGSLIQKGAIETETRNEGNRKRRYYRAVK